MAPTVINTFLEAYDFSDKMIVLFSTSGGSDFGNTLQELQPSALGAEFRESKVLIRIVTDSNIQDLIKDCESSIR